MNSGKRMKAYFIAWPTSTASRDLPKTALYRDSGATVAPKDADLDNIQDILYLL